MSLTHCPPSLRGELTRWLIEIRPMVYVGHTTARVREELWLKACKESQGGSVLQIWSSNTEQGFMARSWGAPDYILVDFEGILLVQRPNKTFEPDGDITDSGHTATDEEG